MCAQQVMCLFNAGKQSGLPFASTQRVAQRAAHTAPLGFRDVFANASVGKDLDTTLRQQHVHKYAGIGFGIPHPQVRERFRSTLARIDACKYTPWVETRFDRHAHLPAMRAFALGHRLGDRVKLRWRKVTRQLSPAAKEVLVQTG